MKNLVHALEIFFMLTLLCDKANAQWSIETISFESPSSAIIIDTAGYNLWQIGRPHKTYFESAHSGDNAMLTDTLNAYPPNDTSSFIYVIRNPYTQTCQTCMEFWHKYDMDSLADQGIIEASYDAGNSWLLVQDTFPNLQFNSTFFWDPDYHASTGNYTTHLLITSGKSDGWIQSKFCWQWFLPVSGDTIIANPDSLLIRFTFISDSIDHQKEGWMIDDIVTSSLNPEHCTGIQDVYLHEHVIAYPNPFSFEAIIETDNAFKNATLVVYNSIGQPVKQIKDITGQSVVLSRDNLPNGLYLLKLTQGYRNLKTIKILISDN